MKAWSVHKESMQKQQIRHLLPQLGLIIRWKSLNPQRGGCKLRQCIRQDGWARRM